MIRRVFGVFALSYGIGLYGLAWLPGLLPYDLTVQTFLFAGLVFLPFCLSVGRFELGTDESPAPPHVKQNIADLHAVCRWWPGLSHAAIVLIGLNWLAFVIDLPTHPFYAFPGGVSFLSGAWFLLVHQTATELFDARIQS